jgi:hypothetical protein
MSLIRKIFGKRSQFVFRRKELQELADGVLSEAFLIQELTTAKAAAIAGGLSQEDAARVLAKTFSYYHCLDRPIFYNNINIPPPPLLKYVVITEQAAEVISQAPSPFPDVVRSWVTGNWQKFFTEYGV